MESAASRSGRPVSDIVLVAVTKGVDPEMILKANQAGLSVFGENRLQEAQTKIPQGPSGVQWHMVGHLQSNKVREALGLFSMIQSVDSVRLAEKINREAQAVQKAMPVLLEVNISGEAQKYGFGPEEIYAAVETVAELPFVRVEGLMGIAPNTPDLEQRQKAFRKLKNIFGILRSLKNRSFEMRYLSMGMSDDFEIAIEEGANMLRLGRVIFS